MTLETGIQKWSTCKYAISVPAELIGLQDEVDVHGCENPWVIAESEDRLIVPEVHGAKVIAMLHGLDVRREEPVDQALNETCLKCPYYLFNHQQAA